MQPSFSGFGRNAEMSRMEPNQPSSQAPLRRSNQISQGDFSSLDSMQSFPSRIGVQITPKWDDMSELTKYTAAKHQTLFAMDTSGQAIIGTPTNPDEIKRVCASITSYMKPRFVVQLIDQNGQPLKLSLQTRTTIVNATTGESDEGTCDHCKQVAPSKRPIVYQWRSGRNKLFSEILGQTDEQGRQVLDIKIGCLTGTGLSRQQKGHKHDFMIRTEVIQYPGVSGYSVAIQMGSKYIDCSQKHTKKKLEKEVEQMKTKKVTQKQNSPQEAGGNSFLPMQLSPTSSSSLLSQFGETNIQKHGIVLPPLANITEVGKKPIMREEIQNNSTPAIAFPVREPWNQETKRIEPNLSVERIGAAILPPIKTLSQFEQGSEAFHHRQALPPVRMNQEEPVIPPLEVILSSISQDHGNNWQDSHHRSPMLELAENFMEAASSMEQSIAEQGNSTGHSSLDERQLKKQRLRQELFNSDHSFRSYSSIFEGRPLSPMNEMNPSMPSFESRSSPSIEGVLGCSTNALTMEQRAEIWQFLCGNRTNPGMDPLRYIILNQEQSLWNVHHTHHSSVIPVEQTILELNYETGRWSTYKNQGKYHLT